MWERKTGDSHEPDIKWTIQDPVSCPPQATAHYGIYYYMTHLYITWYWPLGIFLSNSLILSIITSDPAFWIGLRQEIRLSPWGNVWERKHIDTSTAVFSEGFLAGVKFLFKAMHSDLMFWPSGWCIGPYYIFSCFYLEGIEQSGLAIPTNGFHHIMGYLHSMERPLSLPSLGEQSGRALKAVCVFWALRGILRLIWSSQGFMVQVC